MSCVLGKVVIDGAGPFTESQDQAKSKLVPVPPKTHFTPGLSEGCACGRALFGEGEECITTVASWQMMIMEARWVGRALYDAEEVVLARGQSPVTAL